MVGAFNNNVTFVTCHVSVCFKNMVLLGKLFDGDFFRLFEPEKSNLYDVLQS